MVLIYLNGNIDSQVIVIKLPFSLDILVPSMLERESGSFRIRCVPRRRKREAGAGRVVCGGRQEDR